jgi:hypothetical protein
LSASRGGFIAAVYHPTNFGFVPVTTYPGLQRDPSLSPDGTLLAFLWDGADEQKFHIYIKTIGPGPPLQLTKESTDDIAQHGLPTGAPSHSCEARAADTTTSSSFQLLVARNKN